MSVDNETNGPRGQIAPEDREAIRKRSDEIGRRLDEAKHRTDGPAPPPHTMCLATSGSGGAYGTISTMGAPDGRTGPGSNNGSRSRSNDWMR